MNQEGGWDEHCRRCRSFILRAVEFYRPEKISILGSGWLLDVPLAEIAEKAKKICLIDIVHPPEVIKQCRNFENVELLELDVTGGVIEDVWKKAGRLPFIKKLKSLKEIIIPEFKPEGDPGLIISLNILTQLETLPVSYLNKKAKIPEDEMAAFRSTLQKKHIDFLMKYNSVLISDVAEIFTDNSGKRSEEKTLMTVIPTGRIIENWTWDFDLKSTDYYNKRSVMEVVAVSY
jgi:hypothetical protein